jgi:shikimate kinase
MFLPVFICGMPGSGKTAFGKKLAASLGFDFFDLDKCIESASGLSVSEIFDNYGEFEFRRVESEQLTLLTGKTNAVIACGGGTPCFGENLVLMKSKGLCVLIDIPLGAIKQRLLADRGFEKRPLLGTDEQTLEENLLHLFRSRESCYNAIDLKVRPMQQSKKEILELIQSSLISLDKL